MKPMFRFNRAGTWQFSGPLNLNSWKKVQEKAFKPIKIALQGGFKIADEVATTRHPKAKERRKNYKSVAGGVRLINVFKNSTASWVAIPLAATFLNAPTFAAFVGWQIGSIYNAATDNDPLKLYKLKKNIRKALKNKRVKKVRRWANSGEEKPLVTEKSLADDNDKRTENVGRGTGEVKSNNNMQSQATEPEKPVSSKDDVNYEGESGRAKNNSDKELSEDGSNEIQQSNPEVAAKDGAYQKTSVKNSASTQQKSGNSDSPKHRTEASASRANLDGLKGTAQSKSHTTVQESSISRASTGKTSPKTQPANTDGKSTLEVASKGGAHQKTPAKNTASTQQKSGNSDSPKPRTEASASRSNLEGLKGTAQSKLHTSVQESSNSKVSTGKTSPKTQAANTDGKSTPEVVSKYGAHQKASVKNTASTQQKSGNLDSPKPRTEASASRSNLEGLKGTAQSKSHTSVQESSISKASTGKTSPKTQAANPDGKNTPEVASKYGAYQKAPVKNTASTQQKSGNSDSPKSRTEASASRSNLDGLKGTAQSKSHTSVQESSISKASTGKTSPKTQAANTNGKSTPEVAFKDGAHQKAPVKNTASTQQKSGNSDSPKIRIEASASKANLDGLKAGARKGDSQIGHQAEGKGKKHAVTANDSPKKTDGKVHDNNHPQSGLAGLKKYASKDNKASHTSKGHEANVSASAEGISKLKGSSKTTGHQANSSGKSKSSGISKKVDGGMSM